MPMACTLALALLLSSARPATAFAQAASTAQKQNPQTAAITPATATASKDADRHASRHNKKPPPASPGVPRKIIVRQGGASEPAAQMAPDLTTREAARQRQSAEERLRQADDQLKVLSGRTLDAPRQEMVSQIRHYMVNARSALDEGDLRRANTLAEKAYLLANDLVKR